MCAAPKGNKYALGHEGGRPPIFVSPAELQSKIDEYFQLCPDKKTIVVGETTIDVPIPTICGLALFLGFESRQSFYDYERNEVFSYTIKKARLRIEQKYEQNLSFGNPTGSIFALKNLGWIDSQTFDHKNNGGSFNNLSDAELIARIDKLIKAGDKTGA
jgi:hypothetical protein